jgi:hypothetical protein
MGKETFLLLFVLGAATLAVWAAVRLPGLAPQSLRAATVHIGLALLLSFAMEPAMHLVPGLPARVSVMAALFAIALPAMTYMFLSGLWFMKLMAAHPLARRR